MLIIQYHQLLWSKDRLMIKVIAIDIFTTRWYDTRIYMVYNIFIQSNSVKFITIYIRICISYECMKEAFVYHISIISCKIIISQTMFESDFVVWSNSDSVACSATVSRTSFSCHSASNSISAGYTLRRSRVAPCTRLSRNKPIPPMTLTGTTASHAARRKWTTRRLVRHWKAR